MRNESRDAGAGSVAASEGRPAVTHGYRRPLSGVRVVEFGSWVAAPAATGMLADLGADVIKVEPPSGDPSRAVSLSESSAPSPVLIACNAGKRSVVLDLKAAADQEVARRLIASADVVVENMHTGMAGYGLDPDDLRAQDPSLIWVSVRGYGPSGEWRARPAVDPILQAETGMLAVTGPQESVGYRTGYPVVDFTTAHIVVGQVLAALLARHHTQRGTHITQSLYASALSLQVAAMTDYLHSGTDPSRIGNESVSGAPSGLLRAADGWIMLAATADHQWRRVCRTLEREDLLDDERFVDTVTRMKHREALTEELETTTSTYGADALVALLAPAGVMVGRVSQPSDVLATSEVRDNGLLASVVAADGTEYQTLKSVYRSAWVDEDERPALPEIGAHTAEVVEAL